MGIVQSQQLWPLALYGTLVLIVVGSLLGISAVLGQRHSEPDTGQPYESGVIGTGSARLRFDVQFYLVAVFFVVFDLEAMFVLAWAVGLRQAGWAGFRAMSFFILVLLATLVYVWREGALDWSAAGRRRHASEEFATPVARHRET